MRLDTFLLADFANAAEGKLYISGGGVTRLNVPTTPFVVPMLALVVRFVVEGPDDYGEHVIRIQVETPSGVGLLPEEAFGSVMVEPSPMAAPGEEHAVQMALNFGTVPIPEPGDYTVSTHLDDQLVRQMNLPVVLVEDGAQRAAPSPANRAERRRQQRSGNPRRRA